MQACQIVHRRTPNLSRFWSRTRGLLAGTAPSPFLTATKPRCRHHVKLHLPSQARSPWAGTKPPRGHCSQSCCRKHEALPLASLHFAVSRTPSLLAGVAAVPIGSEARSPSAGTGSGPQVGGTKPLRRRNPQVGVGGTRPLRGRCSMLHRSRPSSTKPLGGHEFRRPTACSLSDAANSTVTTAAVSRIRREGLAVAVAPLETSATIGFPPASAMKVEVGARTGDFRMARLWGVFHRSEGSMGSGCHALAY